MVFTHRNIVSCTQILSRHSRVMGRNGLVEQARPLLDRMDLGDKFAFAWWNVAHRLVIWIESWLKALNTIFLFANSYPHLIPYVKFTTTNVTSVGYIFLYYYLFNFSAQKLALICMCLKCYDESCILYILADESYWQHRAKPGCYYLSASCARTRISLYGITRPWPMREDVTIDIVTLHGLLLCAIFQN